MNDILRQVGKRRIFKSFSGAKYTFGVPGLSKPVKFLTKRYGNAVSPRRNCHRSNIQGTNSPSPTGHTRVGRISSLKRTSESAGRRKVSYLNVRGQLHKGGSLRSPTDFSLC